jgi:heat shock protein HslJ
MLLVVVAFAASVVGACGADGLIRHAQPNTLDGTTWRAVEVNGRPTVSGREPTVVFTGTEIRGSGGCNNYFGTYTWDPSTGEVDLGVTGMTAMACLDQPGAEIETAFVQALDQATSVSIDPTGRLVLSGPGGDTIFAVDAVPR